MALIADVFDVVLIDSTDDSVIATSTLQTANITVAVSEVEVRGGKGNQLLGVLHANRDITIDLTDAEFRYDWLAKQLGQPIVTGAGVAYAMPKYYEVQGSVGSYFIELDETPLALDSIKMYDDIGVIIPTKLNVKLSGKKVTLESGFTKGDVIEVRTFTYATKESTETISIDNTVFAKGVKAILETIEISGSEVPLYKLQYQFDETSPTGNFNINTQSERTAATQNFQLKVIKPKHSTVVGRTLRIPLS